MRIVTTGGVLLAVPHVAGFAAGPTAWQVQTSAPPQPSAFSLRSPPRHQAALDSAHRHRRGAEPTLAAAESAWSFSNQGGLGCRRHRRRQRQWWATPTASSVSATRDVTMTSPLPAAAGASTLGDSSHVDGDHEPTSSGMTASADDRGVGMGLRLAVVGPNADEVGVRMAERHGLAATSMDELMKGRKGRRTDAVKAKAASKWLKEEKGAAAAGGILTGFPTTAAQAESLEKQGVALEHLVVVVREALAGEPPQSNEDDANGSEKEEKEEGVEDELLLTSYEGKVVKVAAGAESDIESLCDSVARLVVTRPLPDSGGASGPADGAVGRVGLGATKHAVDVDSEEEAQEEAEVEEEAQEEEGPLLASIATMSPSERQLAEERDPASYEAAVRLSRSGAEAKRAAKEKTKQKKRDANEAQQMDTPFYVAVAQGQPKARFRPQAPTVPSRITERLQSAASAPEGEGAGGTAANTRLQFGPLVIDSPASDCLLAAGITEPTGIQAAGMGPILAGESVILHAMTGSGKTLTFLLPLMQRWAPGLFSASAAGAGAEAEADGPFRVLLALPTRELAVQVAREVVLLSGGLTASVELLVDSSVFHDLSSVKAPIVVGSAKVLERLIRKSRPTVRAEVLPRVKCIVVDEVDRLVDVLSKHAPPKEVEKRKRHARPIAALLERVLQSSPDVQVVACSATIGRPLRRELGHIVRRSSALRSADGVNGDGVGGGSDGGSSSTTSGNRELRVVRDPLGASAVENLATERARVTAVVAHLRRSGGDVGRRAVALHEAMGFVSDEERGGVRGQHASEAIQQHDRLAEEFRGVSTGVGGGEGGGGAAGVGDADLLEGSGVGGRLREGEAGALLVTGEDSARGLHFDDVDFVFLMQRPKSPDEYVHLAGRTGRQGRTGTVVTLVEFEEFRRLQAWSNSLKVHFEPLDILKVVKQR
ncbi:unnamed protein product [Laminaria digitata]